jgi:geranylgeranyl reductase family protein
MRERAAVERGEIAVVGAGPAGSVCAIGLLEHGHEVTIIDQSAFPRDKPCGDGLTRSAIAMLERLGLDRLVRQHQQIHGGRVIPVTGPEMTIRFVPQPGRAAAGACIPRTVLDHALLEAALQRGARFVRARVDAPIVVDGVVRGVRYLADGVPREFHARHVVAADGATSRMRRATFGEGAGRSGRAYAARAYFRVERPLDPVFDMYGPIVVAGRALPGYAWVFPLDEHRANVGVGFVNPPGPGPRVSIRRLFDAAVDHLRGSRRARFGDMEQEGALFGSPVALRFERDHCQCDGMTFVGDAANTVDPYFGDGIGYAMYGGELVADRVHRRLAYGASTHDVGRRLARRFPRLGQRPWRVPASALGMARDHRDDGRDVLTAVLDEPFLATVVRVTTKAEIDPSIRDTPLWRVAEGHGEAYVDALDRLDEALSAVTATSSPLIGEIVHREMRAFDGPVGAATVLFTVLASGGAVDEQTIQFAVAAALLGVLHGCVSQMSDHAGGALTAAANDRLVVMVADFAHSRAAVAAAGAGPALMGMVARAGRLACEGQMLQREDQGRLVPRYRERVAATAGSMLGVAARAGAALAGADTQTELRLERFGFELGCARKITDELADLLLGDRTTGRDPGAAARRGIYCLPVLDVARRSAPGSSPDDLVAAARSDVGAVDTAVRSITDHGSRARELVETSGIADPSPLVALAERTMTQAAELRSAVVSGDWRTRGHAGDVISTEAFA